MAERAIADSSQRDPSAPESHRDRYDHVQDPVPCWPNSPAGGVLWTGDPLNDASVRCSVQLLRPELDQDLAFLRRSPWSILACWARDNSRTPTPHHCTVT
jgi:hypothetical protein